MAVPKVFLKSQIAALEAFCDGSYTGWHGARRDLHRDHMRAALVTLKFVDRHDAAIRAAVATANEASS